MVCSVRWLGIAQFGILIDGYAARVSPIHLDLQSDMFNDPCSARRAEFPDRWITQTQQVVAPQAQGQLVKASTNQPAWPLVQIGKFHNMVDPVVVSHGN